MTNHFSLKTLCEDSVVTILGREFGDEDFEIIKMSKTTWNLVAVIYYRSRQVLIYIGVQIIGLLDFITLNESRMFMPLKHSVPRKIN